MATPSWVQGEAKLHIGLKEGSFSADHLVVMRPPDSLRLDTLSFFGSPLALLLMRDGALNFWDIEGNHVYFGEATRETLLSILPIGVDPRQISALVLGHPPFEENEAFVESLALDYDARAYRIDRVLGDGVNSKVERWFVSPSTGRLMGVRYEERGLIVSAVAYEGFEETPTGILPKRMEWVGAEGALSWRWKELEVDPKERDPAAFDVVIPSSVPRLPIGRAALPRLMPKEETGQAVPPPAP